MPPPAVSVIMNCYNGASFLKETLISLVNQTFSDWEVVFWDNRSADESAEIFHEYDDPRFRYYLSDRHTSLGEARNLAVTRAKGEWLAFLDCDDLWLPNKLELQLKACDRNETCPVLVYCRTRYLRLNKRGVWSPAGEAPGPRFEGRALPDGDVFEVLLDLNFVNWSSVLVRKEAYDAVGGIDPDFHQAEDFDLLLRLAKYGCIHAVQECCCYYRIHEHNVSWSQIDLRYVETIQSLLKHNRSESVNRALRSQYASYFMHLLLRERSVKKAMPLLGRFSLIDLNRVISRKLLTH